MLTRTLTLGLGTCFVVIAMRNMFVEGELPGETPSKSAGSDISSFAELYQNALEIYAECSQPEVNQPGWYPAGRPPTSSNRTVSLAPLWLDSLTGSSRRLEQHCRLYLASGE